MAKIKYYGYEMYNSMENGKIDQVFYHLINYPFKYQNVTSIYNTKKIG